MVNVQMTEFGADTVQLQELNVEIDQGESDHEFEFEEDVEVAVVLVEIMSGKVDIKLTDFPEEDCSKHDSVKLYLGRLAGGARHLAVRLASKGKSVVRLTVAFFKRNFKDAYNALPCNACKAVCRLAVHALLAHFAIPYITATQAKPVSIRTLGMNGEHCRQFLMNYGAMANQGQLGVLFDHLGSQFVTAITGAFEFVDWVFNATEGLYAKACEMLGCCKSAGTHA